MILCLAIDGRTIGHALTGAEPWPSAILDLGSCSFGGGDMDQAMVHLELGSCSFGGGDMDQAMVHLERLWRRGEQLGAAPGLVLYAPPPTPSMLGARVEAYALSRGVRLERVTTAEPLKNHDGITARGTAEGVALAVAAEIHAMQEAPL